MQKCEEIKTTRSERKQPPWRQQFGWKMGSARGRGSTWRRWRQVPVVDDGQEAAALTGGVGGSRILSLSLFELCSVEWIEWEPDLVRLIQLSDELATEFSSPAWNFF